MMPDANTEAALREMSRSIGGLESTVKTLVTTWQSQELSASQGRRDLHIKFDALSEKVTGLSAKVDEAIRDITDIKPSVEAFDIAKERAKGATMLGRYMWLALLASAAFVGWLVANWGPILSRLPH